eukprot:gene10642-11770_t
MSTPFSPLEDRIIVTVQPDAGGKESCSCEFHQRYDILDPRSGQQVYYAHEESDFCAHHWLDSTRPFEMGVFDFSGKEVLHMSRPFRCAGMMLPPCLDEFTITSSDGRLLGTVKQKFGWCLPRFDVLDHNDQVIFNIKGPCTHCRCDEVPFKIYSVGENTECGAITKRWTGLAMECCTGIDFFHVQFPPNLDVRLRACLLGACFSI